MLYLLLTDTSGVVGRFGDASNKDKGKSKETGPDIHSVRRLRDASNMYQITNHVSSSKLFNVKLCIN